MRRYIVVQDDGDYIAALGVYEDYTEAIGKAYLYASDLYAREECIRLSAIEETEGETGMVFTVYKGSEVRNTFLILWLDDEED